MCSMKWYMTMAEDQHEVTYEIVPSAKQKSPSLFQEKNPTPKTQEISLKRNEEEERRAKRS